MKINQKFLQFPWFWNELCAETGTEDSEAHVYSPAITELFKSVP